MERACRHTRGGTLNGGSGQLCKMLLESLEGQGARWPRSVTTWRLQRRGCWGHEEADNPEVTWEVGTSSLPRVSLQVHPHQLARTPPSGPGLLGSWLGEEPVIHPLHMSMCPCTPPTTDPSRARAGPLTSAAPRWGAECRVQVLHNHLVNE